MRLYIPIKIKFIFTLVFATAWALISIYLSLPWLDDLSTHIGFLFALYLILYIAIIPGFMNSFLLCSLLLDNRPTVKYFNSYPDVTILVAAYNEAPSIKETLLSLINQDYLGLINITVINDGSSDATLDEVKKLQVNHPTLKLIDLGNNGGKAAALNAGLKHSSTDLIITVDGDCWIKTDGVGHLVNRYLSDPAGTKAVAGAILIRNSRENWITKAQEWDYFLGIAAIKRIQSLFQGTLVAQGAFSLYERATLIEVGGWPKTVGEDIVLTWKILAAGYRVGHAEDACAFTRCPNSIKQFVRQRQRWSRGMIEAFKANPKILFKPRYSLLYILWNTQFPLMDIAYTIGFIPGLVLALFGKFWIVGPMTLSLIPIAILLNRVMYKAGSAMFEHEHLKIRRNRMGFLSYMLVYSFILQPACVWGYISEIFNLKKNWGTK
jgi:biofilm PGA synthesis N-glycosyltransferase PgaC